MIVINELDNLKIEEVYAKLPGFEQENPPSGTAIAIGKFDGVHKGHKLLIEELLREQRENGLVPTILTFEPSPEVFFGFGPDQELSTREEKHRLFERMGIQIVVEFPFNEKTAKTPPESFIRELLVEKLHAKFIAAGTDLSFGDKGAGNFELLAYLAPRYGYEAKMINKVEYEGQVISSTLVRDLVAKGQMECVTACLGEPYHVLGKVRHGNQIGRTIDIPTVNQIPEEMKLLPPRGVYYSDVTVDGVKYHGMTNIGVKPSVTDGHELTVETYIYDFSGDIYGEIIVTDLLTFRRPERRFQGLEELKQVMHEDIEAGRSYFGI